MKNFKNFAIYGLPVCSLSNICAADAMEAYPDKEMDNKEMGDMFPMGDLNDLGGLLGNKNNLSDLTNVLTSDDKEAGLKLLNEHIFSEPNNAKDLTNSNSVYYKFSKKKIEDKDADTLFVLFHGLGQSLDDYNEEEIKLLQDKFNADILLIEYNLNGEKTNTFGEMEAYCEEVADFISKMNYKNNIFFGYSLGSFVGNLTRQKFNEINEKNINDKEITSKYIGYKGIKDLENAGSSFIKTFTNNSDTEENICKSINALLNVGKFMMGHVDISIKTFSDLFKYLLGDEEFEKIKKLTTNARILKETEGFRKEKVVFNDELNKANGHCINLKDDIEKILEILNKEGNKDKDVFLFQVKGGDEVVGNGMADTYKSLTGKEPEHIDPKLNPKVNPKDNKDEHTPIQQQGGQAQEGQPQGGQDTNKGDQKSTSCCGF